ncbi:hypothetical protein DFJ74DRAFT_649336 [Hyaloraphidium curvatum]|nr:hypothetical protein DFJ74DRAFT_649336 [Hyaloraphidium curvatum]
MRLSRVLRPGADARLVRAVPRIAEARCGTRCPVAQPMDFLSRPATPAQRVWEPASAVAARQYSSALSRIRKFWKKAEVKETPEGYLVQLDGRNVKTPGGKPLLVPKDRRLLAHMIAGEWESVEKMRSYSIPLTSLAARAVEDFEDPAMRQKAIQDLLKYFQTDTVCFREPYPMTLVEMQKNFWDPLIAWVAVEFGCDVKVTDGIEAITQDPKTVETLRAAVEALDPFELAAFERMVLNTKSYIISLAVVRRFLNVEEATAAARVELEHQINRWGEVEDTHDVDREEIRRQIGSAVIAILKEQ